MKLFVVGEDSPDPKTWSRWGRQSIVIAADAKDALKVAGVPPGQPVAEIPMDKPLQIARVMDRDPE